MSFRQGGFRQPKEQVVLDLTPLIDCVFQLLIFFLLTASFISTPNLGVELPKASSKASASQQRDILVVITRTGQIELNKEKLTPEGLMKRLKAIHAKRPNTRVLINADRKSYHGRVVRVMDIAKTVGFRRLGVSIQRR